MLTQSKGHGLLWPAICTLVVGAILVSLGIWQLQRLHWKERLIAEIAQRADARAVPLPAQATWFSFGPALAPDDYDYRHVEIRGTFDYGKEAFVFRPSGPEGLGPGYLVLTPLQRGTGGFVIVNRGFVPEERKDAARRKEGQVEGEVLIAGLMRPPESRNLFTPADEPAKNLYFTRDPAVIAAHFGLADVAPFTIDADARDVPGGWPKGGTTLRVLPNNHLEYALTWFGLAVGLAGVFVFFVIRRLAGPAR